MAYGIDKTRRGYEWWCAFSTHGAATGEAATLAEAKVRLAIAQADLLEHPFAPSLVEAMLADPERFAADYPDPPIARETSR